jgi:hypothetical protein
MLYSICADVLNVPVCAICVVLLVVMCVLLHVIAPSQIDSTRYRILYIVVSDH